MIVMRTRRKISSRRGDISLVGSCPVRSFWTRVRNIFWKVSDVILNDADSYLKSEHLC